MGQCVKCGRETPHSYTYYSGKREGSTSQVLCNQRITTITYGNITPHLGFLCGRHINISIFLGMTGITFLSLVIVGFVVIQSLLSG